MDIVDVGGAVDVFIEVELVAFIVVDVDPIIDVVAVTDDVVDLAQALNIKIATNMKLSAM